MKKIISSLLLCVGFHMTLSQTYLCLARKAGDKNWGYINEKGDFAIQPRPGKCMEFSPDGLAVVLPQNSKVFGFINSEGAPLPIPRPNFKLKEVFGFDVEGFKGGMVAIGVGNVWGFINTHGMTIIPPKYDGVTEFNGGFASAKSGKKIYIIDIYGKETLVEGADDVKHFSDGLAPYYSKSGPVGFIDTNGKVVIQPTFKSVGYFIGGIAWAKTSNGKIGFIDKAGQWVVQPKYEAAKEIDPISRMALVKSDGQWGYISPEGEDLKIELDTYADFSDGLCRGKKNGLVGFFDKTGKWVVPPKFEAVRDFQNGYAAAKNGLWGMIDKTGEWVIQPSFEGIRDMQKIN